MCQVAHPRPISCFLEMSEEGLPELQTEFSVQRRQLRKICTQKYIEEVRRYALGAFILNNTVM